MIPSPTPTHDPMDSPLGRYLLNPGGTIKGWVASLWHVIAPLIHLGAKVLLILATVFAVGAIFLLFRKLTRPVAEARWMSILLPPQVDPSGAETLWLNLVELLRSPWRRLMDGQPHLSFEYLWSSEGLKIGIWVPGSVVPDLVERAVEAAWPGSQIELMEVPNPLGKSNTVLGGELRLEDPEWFPLRTDHASDALRALLGAAGGDRLGEHAAVQVLVRPVTRARLAGSYKAAKTLRTGKSAGLFDKFIDAVTPGAGGVARPPADDPTRGPNIRMILDKAAGPGWEMVVRYAVGTTETGRDCRQRLKGRAHAIASSFGAFSGRNRLSRRRLSSPARAMLTRRLSKADLVSVEELGCLAHLPTDLSVPELSRAGARPVAPAAQIPQEGKILGDSDAGARRPVAITAIDANRHVHVLGATGTGKSTLLINMILGDVAAKRGVVVVDPKGDLIADILNRLPDDPERKLVLIDPDDGNPPCMNLLEGDDAELEVDHLVGIFRRIFQAYWGPRTDDVLRAACLTLRSDKDRNSTLADVPLLLSDAEVRAGWTSKLIDPVGLGGFWKWYESLSESQQSQVIGPVMNKLRAFLLRGFVRKVVGHPESSFSMGEDILNGGVLLVRVPKGIVGDETAKLLGSFVVARVWQAATARAKAGEKVRVDAALYVDECQNFLNLPGSIEEMLAEARGYRLSLILAHQYLGQLPKDLRDGISANARNKIIFNVSPEDAHSLARHFEPLLLEHDLCHLGGFQAAARLMVNGAEQPAFTFRTRPAPDPIPGASALAHQRSVKGPGEGADAEQVAQTVDGRLKTKSAKVSPDGSADGSPDGSVARS